MIDPAKLSAWFDAHAARLVLYARQLSRPRAQDVVQEAFVALMHETREPANVKGWLYRAVRNAAISAVRAEQARVRRHAALAKSGPTWFDGRPDDLIDAAATQGCLETLPPARREVIVLRIWSEMSFPEIGELTGLPVSTVFDHYRKGLAAIREKMESSCHANK
ncbi:MAG: RNA polymerase sigma factor, partial [Tepidisphaeraceae bacterium]